jgi:hypothetical protein
MYILLIQIFLKQKQKQKLTPNVIINFLYYKTRKL